MSVLSFCIAIHAGSLDLTVGVLDKCPMVTFSCSAVDLPASDLRWFFNGIEFVRYLFLPSHEYPLSVEPENNTLNSLVGGVDIQIISACPNMENRDHFDFLSTMTANILALQRAEISSISCGSAATKRALNISRGGENFPLHLGVARAIPCNWNLNP